MFIALITGKDGEGKLRDMMKRSVLSPLLLLCRRALLMQLLFHESNGYDVILEIALEGFLKNFPAIFIGIYYSLYIQETGVTLPILLSLFWNCCEILGKVFDVIKYFSRKRLRAKEAIEKGKKVTSFVKNFKDGFGFSSSGKEKVVPSSAPYPASPIDIVKDDNDGTDNPVQMVKLTNKK